MCGRFALYVSEADLAALFGCPELAGFRLERRYNIAPGQWILILRPEGGARVPRLARWGLIPSWTKDPAGGPRPINARAETLARKPSFRTALDRSRCIVPASGFFEWRKADRQPFFIRMKGGAPFAFAALEETWRGPEGTVRTCAVITTEPNGLVAPVHDRMPVILGPEAREAWLDPGNRDREALLALLRPFPAEAMEAWPVGPAVGSPARDAPSLVDPVDPPAGLPFQEDV
jgi:putative SOS response-associated peptidase YedK